jgi:hypothetical protein
VWWSHPALALSLRTELYITQIAALEAAHTSLSKQVDADICADNGSGALAPNVMRLSGNMQHLLAVHQLFHVAVVVNLSDQQLAHLCVRCFPRFPCLSDLLAALGRIRTERARREGAAAVAAAIGGMPAPAHHTGPDLLQSVVDGRTTAGRAERAAAAAAAEAAAAAAERSSSRPSVPVSAGRWRGMGLQAEASTGSQDEAAAAAAAGAEVVGAPLGVQPALVAAREAAVAAAGASRAAAAARSPVNLEPSVSDSVAPRDPRAGSDSPAPAGSGRAAAQGAAHNVSKRSASGSSGAAVQGPSKRSRSAADSDKYAGYAYQQQHQQHQQQRWQQQHGGAAAGGYDRDVAAAAAAGVPLDPAAAAALPVPLPSGQQAGANRSSNGSRPSMHSHLVQQLALALANAGGLAGIQALLAAQPKLAQLLQQPGIMAAVQEALQQLEANSGAASARQQQQLQQWYHSAAAQHAGAAQYGGQPRMVSNTAPLEMLSPSLPREGSVHPLQVLLQAVAGLMHVVTAVSDAATAAADAGHADATASAIAAAEAAMTAAAKGLHGIYARCAAGNTMQQQQRHQQAHGHMPPPTSGVFAAAAAPVSTQHQQQARAPAGGGSAPETQQQAVAALRNLAHVMKQHPQASAGHMAGPPNVSDQQQQQQQQQQPSRATVAGADRPVAARSTAVPAVPAAVGAPSRGTGGAAALQLPPRHHAAAEAGKGASTRGAAPGVGLKEGSPWAGSSTTITGQPSKQDKDSPQGSKPRQSSEPQPAEAPAATPAAHNSKAPASAGGAAPAAAGGGAAAAAAPAVSTAGLVAPEQMMAVVMQLLKSNAGGDAPGAADLASMLQAMGAGAPAPPPPPAPKAAAEPQPAASANFMADEADVASALELLAGAAVECGE